MLFDGKKVAMMVSEQMLVMEKAEMALGAEEEFEALSKRFEHVNFYEDYAIIRDKLTGRLPCIYRRPGNKPFCDVCNSYDCIHVRWFREYIHRLPDDVKERYNL